jgi:hypothetical protein
MNTKKKLALINQSERYGSNVEVRIEDYFELNPDGDFRQSGKLGDLQIVEYLENGMSEVVAKIVCIDR